jgi:hypothetical protein
MYTRLFAVMATVGLVLFALGPGVATVAADDGSFEVEVEQAGNDGPTVTVTENETAVENATVGVEALDNTSYDGTGNYTTDANGTVTLPTVEGNATIEVTATVNNTTVSETEELNTGNETENASFGSEVSMFVQSLLSGGEENIGPQVADFATSNNPGNAPDHAGPPSDNRTGPPENAGPPADAGPGSDDTETDDGNETADSDDDELESEEADDGDDENEEDEEDEDESDEADGDDDDGGPPENPGNARGN